MKMSVQDVQWVAGQLENIANSMTDSLKARQDLGELVDDHHIRICLKQALELSKEAIEKHYYQSKEVE
ncbi:hypothetical protein [Paenibacillus sp. Mc5Re-14]|uniref:hypothetical protein n=1 Tax=Paenibacillus sp. Mc5Re-14 TaxID=1030529 RepID=UPI000AA0E331|nr:hypothetical protein [Paenibacillus sp. Mc5Re-14]